MTFRAFRGAVSAQEHVSHVTNSGAGRRPADPCLASRGGGEQTRAMKMEWLAALLVLMSAGCVDRAHAAPRDTEGGRGSANVALRATYECVVPPNYWGWKNPAHPDTG